MRPGNDAAMASDQEFLKEADRFMEGILASLDSIDPDELDTDLAMGVLSMEFDDGSKCIMNRQTAAHQIWLAEGATAWHFEQDEAGHWIDTKGRGRLEAVLSEVLARRLGKPIEL